MPSNEDRIPSFCCCLTVKHGTYFLAGLVFGGGLCTIIGTSILLSNPVDTTSTYWNLDIQNLHYYGRTAQWLSLGTGVCFVIIALMALYGVTVNKGTYLIPMFLMQIFGFICDMVYIATMFVKWPEVKEYVIKCPNMPEKWKEFIINTPDGYLIAILALVFLCSLTLKLYFISVVYRCYKYLVTKALRARHGDLEAMADEKEKAPTYKLPTYEDIQKLPLFDDVEEIATKPPPYKQEKQAL